MSWLEPDAGALLLRVKVVPGARQNQISGLLGDRLKIRVSAPAEGGKANKAVCQLLARSLGLTPAHVVIERGMTSPEKTVRIEGVGEDKVQSLYEP